MLMVFNIQVEIVATENAFGEELMGGDCMLSGLAIWNNFKVISFFYENDTFYNWSLKLFLFLIELSTQFL